MQGKRSTVCDAAADQIYFDTVPSNAHRLTPVLRKTLLSLKYVSVAPAKNVRRYV
jgi:hypothetical protein